MKIYNNSSYYLIQLLALFFITSYTQAQQLSDEQSCLFQLLNSAPDAMTFGEAREQCSKRQNSLAATSESAPATPEAPSALEKRLQEDTENILQPFTLMSHRENYVLAGAYNFSGWQTKYFEEAYDQESISTQDYEIQFQLSIKTPLALDLFDSGVDLFGAYTVRSFWQAYNTDISSPFRETNHEPEIWLQMSPDLEILGFKNSVNAVGFSHQSNGQGGNLSRSWNRIWAGITFERNNFVIMLNPWMRISEDSSDDNPGITDYMGHGAAQFVYKLDDHTFSLMTRNNIESGFSKGAVELGWSFPIWGYDYLKGYVQYFSGYGESLIDYDSYVNRLGIGLLLTDIL